VPLGTLALGVGDDDLKPLFNSAEAYIRMWERARVWKTAARPKCQ
jgi:hypothetical protein